MSLLTVTGVSKSFGADDILTNITFRLEWGQRLGLVGRNGAGKTTLLRILTGQLEADKGRVEFHTGVRFGYLRQEQMVESGRTVFEEAQDAFRPVLDMEQRLRDLEHHMGEVSGDRLHDVMEEYGLLRDRFEFMGGFDNLRDIPAVLKRLGFVDSDLDKPTVKLSGGEKTRLAMARLLLSGPDILFLDEPTNHLDLEATEWLESFLADFGGGIVVVSHDRYFLDRVVNRVAEVLGEGLSSYNGNFAAFWLQREAERKRVEELRTRDIQEIKRHTEFFEKWKNTPTKRIQAQMRLRWANRIKSKLADAPVAEGPSLKLKLKESHRSGSEVVIVDRLRKSFGSRVLFDDLSFVLNRNMRLGVVGPNGAGKSTLIRMLLGREIPDSGVIRLGAHVTVGYFAQEASDLDLDATVLDNMLDVADMTPEAARTHLGKFLFTADEVFRPVGLLSGGEKNKLALAQLTYLRPNLLILDEPTNHLDMDSREALTAMLKTYDGTLILISHDRYLLDQVTNHTLEIDSGKAKLYPVPFGEYRSLRRTQTAKVDAAPAPTLTTQAAASPTAGMNSHQLSKERKRAVKAVADSERRVAEAEDWLKRIEEALSDPMPGDDQVKLSHDYESARLACEESLHDWEVAVKYAESIGAES